MARTNDDQWKEFQIISKAGKSGGKHGNWLNVHDKEENKALSMDWTNNVKEWKEVEPEEELVSYVYSSDQMEAMFVEMDKWQEYGVYMKKSMT